MKVALNLPNKITVARLVLAVVFFVLLTQYSQRAPRAVLLDVAVILFVVAAGTDFLDGYLARKRGEVTPLGRVLDPLVDKVLICGAFILFVSPSFVNEAGHNVTEVSGWMVLVIVGRELLVTGLRGFNEAQGIPFAASIHGKLKMWMQSIAAPLIMLIIAHEQDLGWGDTATIIKRVLVWLTVLATALSALSYLARSRHILEESAPA